MADKENISNVDAANARLKRKRVLLQKRQKNVFSTNISSDCTPLSQLNQNNMTHGSLPLNQTQKIHSQPSQRHVAPPQIKNATRLQNLAVNLIHRYDHMIGKSTTNHAIRDTPSASNSLFGFQMQTEETSQHTYEQQYVMSEVSSSSEDDHEEENDSNNSLHNATEGYSDIGDPIIQCCYCQAFLWYHERMRKHRHTTVPKFHLCCSNGKVQLPFLNSPPPVLEDLLFNSASKQSKHFQQCIRSYNMMFAFTSPGINLDTSFNNGHGPPNIRVQGESCHRIGSLLPVSGKQPMFAQLYIYDTGNEVDNRIQAMRGQKNIDREIVSKLSTMLDQHNTHAKSFRMARQRLREEPVKDLKLQLIFNRKTDGRIYNIPTVSEVAAIIVGDVNSATHRDIILEAQNGKLQRIDELHPSYLGLQYPLLFPYGEDGYRNDVIHREMVGTSNPKRIRLTIREWVCFRLQSRPNEAQTVLRSRRLFQQFVVDCYLMIESERLSFIRRNQSKLRVDKFCNLKRSDSSDQSQGSTTGKRVILPSTFVGGRRYMDQLYFDGMAICSHVGFPDLFITFTCNPCWPEIDRLLRPLHLKPADRPDIVARIFKIKLEDLLVDLTKKHILGRVVAYMYTIEFQKRGLPHAHLLIFLHPAHKYPTPDHINSIISAEIPNEVEDKELFMLVKSHMMHGPCGLANKSSPCMKNGKCSRYYPKKFQSETIVDQEGFPVYRRRNNGRSIQKNDITLDNRSVVPYSPRLLLKYHAHINMEWCNQSTSIKYLFKYINKGYDRITAKIVPDGCSDADQTTHLDEIKQYLDCRYISPAEACWRIFSFPIHSRKPAVERMFFHLPGEQNVYFNDDDEIDDIVCKPSVTESMFTAWFDANKTYPEAKHLTYGQFVSKFVYVKQKRV